MTRPLEEVAALVTRWLAALDAADRALKAARTAHLLPATELAAHRQSLRAECRWLEQEGRQVLVATAANYAAKSAPALIAPSVRGRTMESVQLKEADMRKILIATDGSAASAEAVEFGLELAEEQEATVLFVHVAPSTDVIPVGAFAGAMPRVPHEIDAHDRIALEEAEELAEQRGIAASSKLLVGDVVDEIVAFADSQDVDLLVVGSRGHGALAAALLGSVSRGVVKESKRPVLVIRGLAREAALAS